MGRTRKSGAPGGGARTIGALIAFALIMGLAPGPAAARNATADGVAYGFNTPDIDCFGSPEGNDKVPCTPSDFKQPQAGVTSPLGDRFKLETKRGRQLWVVFSEVIKAINRPRPPRPPGAPPLGSYASFVRAPRATCDMPVAAVAVASLPGVGRARPERALQRRGADAGIKLAAAATNCVQVSEVYDDATKIRLQDAVSGFTAIPERDGIQPPPQAGQNFFYVVLEPAFRRTARGGPGPNLRRLVTQVRATLIKVPSASLTGESGETGEAASVRADVVSFTAWASTRRRPDAKTETTLWRSAYALAFDGLVRDLLAERDTAFQVKHGAAFMPRPSLGAAAISHLAEGDTVTATGRTTARWREVKNGAGLAGWVRGEFLSPLPSRLTVSR